MVFGAVTRIITVVIGAVRALCARCAKTPPMYIRCVDKGTGILWAFWRHWVWGVLEEFVHTEGYTQAHMTESAAIATIKQAITDRGWEHNKARKLAMLYLIGKGESLQKGQWLWRGITALPQPLLLKHQLRIAARANTTFLRLLTG